MNIFQIFTCENFSGFSRDKSRENFKIFRRRNFPLAGNFKLIRIANQIFQGREFPFTGIL
jgi:hypothetical protein